MIDERTHRAIPLGVTLLIATLAALAALAVSGGPAAQAHGEPAVAAKGSVTGSEFALRQGMRSLWEDHVSWTRLAIISLTTGSPDTKATVARLLRNQSDIGNAIKPYYGAKAGTGLTRLLRRAHPRRGGPGRRREGGRQGEARDRADSLAAERRCDRHLPQQGEPRRVEAR